jgi:hypothetical protein
MLPDIPGLGGIGTLLVGFLIAFIIYLIIIGFVLWVAGEIVVGRRVTFGQAFAIAGAGTFLVLAVLFFLTPLIGLLSLLVAFVLFLALIRRYFKTGWIAALGVAIMAIIVAIIITFVLAVLAIGLFTLPIPPLALP